MTASTSPRLGRDRSCALVLIASGAFLYAFLLWKTKWIADDGWIYLCYVRNLFEHGELSFNLGEPIDAATSFVWLLALCISRAVFFFLTPREACFMLSWACCGSAYWLVARPILEGQWRYALAVAAIFFTPFVVSFSSSGLETPLILLLVVLMYTRLGHRPRATSTAVVFGLAPFARPELGIALGLYIVWMAAVRARRPLMVAASVPLGMALLRWLCFGSVLPNTAFVKLVSSSYGRGRFYFEEFALSYPHLNAMVVALGLVSLWLAGGTLLGWVRRRRPAGIASVHLFGATSTVALLAYVYAAGGDFMHGRFFLAPTVLGVLTAVDAGGSLLGHGSAWRHRSAVLVAGAMGLGATALLSQPHSQRVHFYFRIGVERHVYAQRNRNLSVWAGENLDPWAREGSALTAYAERVGRPVGVVANAIGQLRYASDPARVYIFDHLALTRVSGSLLDNHGYFRRIGHNQVVPVPLAIVNPRVTLLSTSVVHTHAALDDGLRDALTMTIGRRSHMLMALDDIDAHVAAGMLPADTWRRVDQRIEEVLEGELIDRNLVFFLFHRYPRERPLHAEIASHYEGYARQDAASWVRWYETQRDVIELAHAIESGAKPALPHRYLLYWREKTLRPLSSTYQRASWDLGSLPHCELDLDGTLVLPRDVTADISGSNVTLHSAWPERVYPQFHLGKALTKCPPGLDHIILDWEVVASTGSEAGSFVYEPGHEKGTMVIPGPPLKRPLAGRKSHEPVFAMRMVQGQRYVMRFEAVAVDLPDDEGLSVDQDPPSPEK